MKQPDLAWISPPADDFNAQTTWLELALIVMAKPPAEGAGPLG
jgi:hypothetical protein